MRHLSPAHTLSSRVDDVELAVTFSILHLLVLPINTLAPLLRDLVRSIVNASCPLAATAKPSDHLDIQTLECFSCPVTVSVPLPNTWSPRAQFQDTVPLCRTDPPSYQHIVQQ